MTDEHEILKAVAELRKYGIATKTLTYYMPESSHSDVEGIDYVLERFLKGVQKTLPDVEHEYLNDGVDIADDCSLCWRTIKLKNRAKFIKRNDSLANSQRADNAEAVLEKVKALYLSEDEDDSDIDNFHMKLHDLLFGASGR